MPPGGTFCNEDCLLFSVSTFASLYSILSAEDTELASWAPFLEQIFFHAYVFVTNGLSINPFHSTDEVIRLCSRISFDLYFKIKFHVISQ